MIADTVEQAVVRIDFHVVVHLRNGTVIGDRSHLQRRTNDTIVVVGCPIGELPFMTEVSPKSDLKHTYFTIFWSKVVSFPDLYVLNLVNPFS